MKRFAFAIVAVAGLLMVPAAVKADPWHHHGRHHDRHHVRHSHRDWDHHHHHHHRHVPRVIVRRPVVVQPRYVVPGPVYAPYYDAPRSSFYYSGRNLSFGIGF